MENINFTMFLLLLCTLLLSANKNNRSKNRRRCYHSKIQRKLAAVFSRKCSPHQHHRPDNERLKRSNFFKVPKGRLMYHRPRPTIKNVQLKRPRIYIVCGFAHEFFMLDQRSIISFLLSTYPMMNPLR